MENQNISLDEAEYNDLPELIPYRKGKKWGFCDIIKRL